jgi:uncharacterized membrane protein
MAICVNCGAALADGTTFCGSCGAAQVAQGGSAGAPAASSGLAPNVAGALAYVTVIPAILFLVMEPYNKDKFIKFHSFQCLFFAGAWIALSIVMMIVGFILALIPIVGWILDLLLWMALGFGGLIVAILCIYKAYNGQKFMLPVIGKFADQQASR